MQVTCFAFDWAEVRKRGDVNHVLNEMILSDDIDQYATYLPDEIWGGDSGMLHFSVAGALSEVLESAQRELVPGIEVVEQLLNGRDSADELGLGDLTEGCYFVSLSPERVVEVAGVFSKISTDVLAALCVKTIAPTTEEEVAAWLEQWRGALNFARERGLGLIGHCG